MLIVVRIMLVIGVGIKIEIVKVRIIKSSSNEQELNGSDNND